MSRERDHDLQSVGEMKEAIAKLLAVLDRHDVPDALDSRRAQTEIANEIRRTKYAVQVVEIREGGLQ